MCQRTAQSTVQSPTSELTKSKKASLYTTTKYTVCFSFKMSHVTHEFGNRVHRCSNSITWGEIVAPLVDRGSLEEGHYRQGPYELELPSQHQGTVSLCFVSKLVLARSQSHIFLITMTSFPQTIIKLSF